MGNKKPVTEGKGANNIMKVIIVGCGRAGSLLATELMEVGHEVAIIDRNPLAFDKLSGEFQGNMLVGTGIDEEVLVNAGIREAEVVFSLAKGDNTNIMVGQIAKFLFKVPRVMVRIVDPRMRRFYEEEIGLSCYCQTEISVNFYKNFLTGGSQPCI